ncbi:MAG: hypothetical protein ACRD8W_32020, partial [Nitrososphaeraceae archaeon]
MSDIYDSPMNQYRKRQQQKQNGEPTAEEHNPYFYDGKVTNKQRTTLEAIPDDQRDKEKERIYRDKMYSIAHIFKKLGDKAIGKGFLSDPVTKILGAEAFIKYLQPLADDKWTQGEWKNAFEPISKHLNKDNHWTEDPEFVREYRYQIFADGTVT